MLINSEMPVDDVMRHWPRTIRTFIHWGMKCVGCPFGTFHSIDQACVEHGADREAFLAALEGVVQSQRASCSIPQPAE